MTALSTLTRRHILLYVRDRSAVFFSMLSVLIVLLLMLVFLGDMNKDELMQLVQQAHGDIGRGCYASDYHVDDSRYPCCQCLYRPYHYDWHLHSG